MKRVIRRFGMLLAILVIMAGCGQKNGDKVYRGFDSDLEYVQDKKKLVVGVTEFKPLDYIEDGEWTGFDAELAKLFGKKLGVSVEFQEIDWDKKAELLKNGTIDCVWNGMTFSEKAREEMACSMTYLYNGQMIVIPAGSTGQIQRVEDGAQLQYAVESGSAAEKELNDRGYRYTEVDTQKDALELLNEEKVDAAVIDTIMAGALIGVGRQYENLVCTVSMNSERYCIGFRSASNLVQYVDDFLRESTKNDTLTELAEKYGVQDALIHRD